VTPALYPGSFDPPHRGHADLIARAAAIFPGLVVAVAVHPDKAAAFPLATRLAWLRDIAADHPGVTVDSYAGATVRYARSRGIGVLVRGLRSAADQLAETGMAVVNRSHGIDTVFLITDPALAHLSSSLVRSARAAGLPIADLVPAAVARDLA
jgi:pantetheine-phosphate adenylyltransferase